MYDILQLNDMLVPELLDIAEQLKIAGAKKLEKQDLIYKILDKQALLNSSAKGDTKEDAGKKKRIVKTTTAMSTEEAIVESGDKNEEVKPVLDKKPAKRGRPAATPTKNQDSIGNQEETEEIKTTDQQEESQPAENNINEEAPTKQLFIKKEPAFNVEFDGAIPGEGVLEM
ncbi:MAG: transcription termination factor Rho, partial [Bacteroidota bacterium]